MRHCLSVAGIMFLVISSLHTANAKAAEPEPQHASIIGKWVAQTVSINGEQKPPEGDAVTGIEFTADHILIGEQKIAYKVDTETTPKLIDIELKLGEQANLRMLEGIYKIEEGQLTICLYFFTSGAQKRPDTFTAEEGSNRIMVTLKRAP